MKGPFLLSFAFAVGFAAVTQANGDDLAPNDPSQCPWCHGDPELMRASGLVSHGGFDFGRTNTAEVDEYMATSDIKWAETEHFEIGIALASYKVRQVDKKVFRAELAELKEALPEVKVKATLVDPWLRAHLYARRAEKLYDDFLELVQKRDEDFPDGSRPWNTTGTYMGEGPYLGMKGKYEVLILPNSGQNKDYLSYHYGLTYETTHRWHYPKTGTLSVTIHTQQAQLRQDAALHGHVAFNLTHNFLDGFRHYSYETPVWLHEGLAHWVERRLSPRFNTFDSSEGAVAAETRKSNWELEVLKLIGAQKAPRFAQLVNLRTYAELELDDHFTTWSMVDFLVESDPDAFAKLIVGLCAIINEHHISDGSLLKDRQRELFKELYGLTYARVDTAWQEWAKTAYRDRDR